jgi:hypothetical protein
MPATNQIKPIELPEPSDAELENAARELVRFIPGFQSLDYDYTLTMVCRFSGMLSSIPQSPFQNPFRQQTHQSEPFSSTKMDLQERSELLGLMRLSLCQIL